MSDSTHTPGPWQIHQSHVYTSDSDGRKLLAQVLNPGANAHDFPLAANARLIAAAPELLNALLLIVEEPEHELLNTARDYALEVIAKAKGKA